MLLASCAMLPAPTRSDLIGESGPLGGCAEFFASLDSKIKQAGVIDPGVFRVKNYPYLRVNRFLASFSEEVDNEAAFVAWIDHMQALDQEARKYEIANLPDHAFASLTSTNDRSELYSRVATCGNLMKRADFQNDEQKQELRDMISVPDDYITLRRVLGIYPFTSMFVYSGVINWHNEARLIYSPTPPANWRSVRYTPDPKDNISSAYQFIIPTKRDALSIPQYSPDDIKALFHAYAPLWEIRFEGNYDRIGAPNWSNKGVLDVDTDQPVTYTLLSFTRFGKEILTQLNYIVWFPSRPKNSFLDIYGGHLDGLIYRVTLESNNEPLLYETVHNCGCYYKAYPTNRLLIRDKINYAEPPLILEAPSVNPTKEFMTVAMESRNHYVQHLYATSRQSNPTSAVYSIEAYGKLRSLPYLNAARRGMFGQDSISPGSKRLERFILWPMGVHSPGAMRQWGRHAVAFVGKRHFDDPFYINEMFEETNSR
jgi:hypothetical protein